MAGNIFRDTGGENNVDREARAVRFFTYGQTLATSPNFPFPASVKDLITHEPLEADPELGGPGSRLRIPIPVRNMAALGFDWIDISYRDDLPEGNSAAARHAHVDFQLHTAGIHPILYGNADQSDPYVLAAPMQGLHIIHEDDGSYTMTGANQPAAMPEGEVKKLMVVAFHVKPYDYPVAASEADAMLDLTTDTRVPISNLMRIMQTCGFVTPTL